MLYLRDYLELIEHLPQELRDRLTLIRENDLKVNNSSLHIDTKVRQFFAEAKNFSSEQKQCNYEEILKEYESTLKHADDKVQIATQTQEIIVKLIQKLDGELEKFKLELEADHAGITEELERRSLELDADMRLDNTINGYLDQSTPCTSLALHNQQSRQQSSAIKDRRRSEHRQHQRHHPYQNNHQDNGFHVRAKLSQNHDDLYHNTSTNHNKQMPRQPHNQQQHNRVGRPPHNHFNNVSRQNSAATSPQLNRANLPEFARKQPFINGDHLATEMGMIDGHHNNDLTSFGNNSSFRSSHKNNNLSFNQQHSALSAALSSSTTPSPHTMSTLAMMNSSSVHNNKISSNGTNLKGADMIDPNDPLAAAASQAIAATQQLQQGRRTPSLKASYEAIKAGLGHLDPLGYNSKQESLAGRNALAPMAPDQQAFRYTQQYGRMSSTDASSPLYVPVTKSGRPSKRPKHHASHIHPDESPTSIRLDDSVFENSESLSSAEFFSGASPVFGSSSPSSIDFNNSRLGDQGGAYYQRDETLYCKCRQISYGEMVACDNEECEIEWFHYGCVGITQPPKGKWYCPDCLESMRLQNNNSAQTQTQKKRGKKDKSVFNMVNNSSLEIPQVKSKDRVTLPEQTKGVV